MNQHHKKKFYFTRIKIYIREKKNNKKTIRMNHSKELPHKIKNKTFPTDQVIKISQLFAYNNRFYKQKFDSLINILACLFLKFLAHFQIFSPLIYA